MIKFLIAVARRVAVVFAVCDLVARVAFPAMFTESQLFALMTVVMLIRGEFMFDHELEDLFQKDKAAEERMTSLPLARLIGVGISYGMVRVVLWGIGA